MSRPRPGQEFGPYRLDALIARGGMGEVWRATKRGPEGWQKTVALKLILPGHGEDERFAALFLGEARLAALLDHPNIVPVFAFGREAGHLWLELEYVPGTDLRRLLDAAGAGLPPPLALHVLAEILKALDHAHARRGEDGAPLGIVHRDVKPQNVLVGDTGAVKLIDFGIARATAEGASRTELKGTAGYIAPELLDGAGPSARSDLFAAGLVAWELLTGRKLFDGASDAERLRRTLACRVPPLADAGVAVPAEVEAILAGLLAREPAARYPSAAAALTAVRATACGREASSVELRAFLARLALPAPGASRAAAAAAVEPSARTVAGELAGARSSWAGRANRLFASRAVLLGLAGLAAASLAAALLLPPRGGAPPRATPAAARGPAAGPPTGGRPSSPPRAPSPVPSRAAATSTPPAADAAPATMARAASAGPATSGATSPPGSGDGHAGGAAAPPRDPPPVDPAPVETTRGAPARPATAPTPDAGAARTRSGPPPPRPAPPLADPDGVLLPEAP